MLNYKEEKLKFLRYLKAQKKFMNYFKVGDYFPSIKSVTFKNKLCGVNLMVYYSDTI